MNKIKTDFSQWQEQNKQHLISELGRVRKTLESKGKSFENASTYEWKTASSLPALEYLVQKLQLSDFEKDILLLCAGIEFEANWGLLCAEAQGDPQKNYPTFALALAIFPTACWEALTPTAPLRKWQLIEIKSGHTLTNSLLRIDERILHYLAGVNSLDERLIPFLEPLKLETTLALSHQHLTQQLIETWSFSQSQFAAIQLCGRDLITKKAIATIVCQKLGLNLLSLSAVKLLSQISQIPSLILLIEREALLNNYALFLDCHYLDTGENEKETLVSRSFIENFFYPLIIASPHRYHQQERLLITFEVDKPTREEQKIIWQTALAEISPSFNNNIDSLISNFNLNSTAIKTVCLKLKSLDLKKEKIQLTDELWNICRNQARPRLDELAQQIKTNATWDDLILPSREREVLEEIAIHLKQKTKVYQDWGLGDKSTAGLGISVLFAGASGTGKTMAAEILGHHLKLDVYRVDLSSVVSKYIGETEKNLRRIFDAAEDSGAILLFDEADALFGKRSEVKDSHDRYANMEVSYLLQKIEAYQGLSILTTNLKNSIDQAFIRRLRFIVQFPFPDAEHREKIWQRIFTPQIPKKNLEFKKLAQLNVSGGNIKNIAINAAFMAADRNEALEMKHILQAVKREYLKLEKTLTEAEIKNWL